MATAELWQLLVQSYNAESVFMVFAPADVLSVCPLAYEPITRATQFLAGQVYAADSFDDVSGQTDLRAHLFVWDVRIPVYRVRTHLSHVHGYVLDAWLDGQKLSSDEFFGRPVGICPHAVYGRAQADQFADEWGWRCGMVYNIDFGPNRRMWHKVEWSGGATFDWLRMQIEAAVGRRRMLWICFPADKNGVLFFQETNPLVLDDGRA